VTTEPDLKQKEKDEALQRRKEELESELDRYAQAGAFSPGLIKFTKWLSRGLYLAMGIAFMAMLFSGWGKVSKEDFDRVNDAYDKWKAEAEREKQARNEAESRLADAEIRAAKLKLELEGLADLDAVAKADAAGRRARDLLERAWGERAYTEHWRKKLENAKNTDADVAEARVLIRHAAQDSIGAQFQLMGEIAEFGQEIVAEAAKAALASSNVDERRVAVRLMSRLGTPVDPAQSDEKDDVVLREIWFCDALPWEYREIDSFYPEAFVGLGLSRSPNTDNLDKAYKNAPEERRLDLLALRAEIADDDIGGLFKMVSTSQRPLAEKIVAVRWMGTRKDEGSRALLQTLSEGSDALAAEAKEAFKKLE
jgi:hypothetical protein